MAAGSAKATKTQKTASRTNSKAKPSVREDDCNDTDSICFSVDDMDTDHNVLAEDTESCEDTDGDVSESSGRTTTSSSCSERSNTSPARLIDTDGQQHESRSRNSNNNMLKHNLTLITQMHTDVWEQKHLQKQKTKSATTCSVHPFSPGSQGSSVRPELMSPLDALLIAADSSFTCLKNATKTSSKTNSTKEKVPFSPSILRRRKSPQKAKQSKKTHSAFLASSISSELSSGDQEEFCSVNDTKLQQLATLSAAPTLSGSISLRGEEFCMSPTDVKRSEVRLLSPYRQQHHHQQHIEESPLKRRKFAIQHNTENISVQKHDHEQQRERGGVGTEENLIAQSLLHMKTAHALAGDFY